MAKEKLGMAHLTAPLPESGEQVFWDDVVPGLCLRRHTTKQTWCFLGRNADGRRVRINIGPAGRDLISVAQARQEAKGYALELANRRDPAEQRRQARRAGLTLGRFFDEHYEIWARQHLKTWQEQMRGMRKEFAPLLDKTLSKITAKEVSDWMTAKIASGRKGAANRYLAYLKAALNRAVSWGLLEKHPLGNLQPVRANENAKCRYLSDAERARLMEAIEEREQERRDQRRSYNDWCRTRKGRDPLPDLDKLPFADMLKPAVLVALNTGMRRSEEFGIRWRHVDFERNAIDLPKEICKSKKPRTIPMTPTVRDTLAAWQAQTGGEDGDLVFANADGKAINIKGAFKNLMERARLKDFTWHSMRHDFASQLVMRGVDVFVVSKLLGHQDVTTTIKHYAHLSPRIQADAVAVLEPTPAENVLAFEKQETGG